MERSSDEPLVSPGSAPSDPALRKELGLLAVFCIASGAMISSGLFVLPGLAFAQAGPAVILAYLTAGALALPALFSKAELSTAMPKAGGSYFFIERSLGGAFGTIGGMAAWLSLTFKTAFALLGMGLFAQLLYPDIEPGQIKAVAIALCVIFMIINLAGARHAGRLQSVLVIALLVALAYYILRGLPNVEVDRFEPFAPRGAGSVFATAGLVFVSYGGLTKAAGVAEETRNPGRNIPLGMTLAFIVVTFAYALAVFTTVGTLDASELAGSSTPISTAAAAFMGTPGLLVMTLAALIAFITTGNAGILSASRTPMAMSRDGLLPGFLGRVNARFGTPHFGILTTGLIMIVAIGFLDLVTLVKVASTMKIILFLLVNLAVVMMRESRIENYRPTFRSPFYPWIQGAGIILYGFLVFKIGGLALALTGAFFGGSLLWYVAYVGIHRRRDSALIQVVRRVTDRDLVPSAPSLEGELREILKQRDEIVEDRFDRLILDCTILDRDQPESVWEFFRGISDVLAEDLDMEPDRVYELLLERERESTTALRPGLAIPHIVVDGSGVFGILLARSRSGIAFSEEAPPVHAVFVLMGSADERNYHLRALMHIAQITQEPGFDERWMRARGVEQLRSIILLGARRRDD
jgi:amino acid transporter/mannitol/fructose-specific phosphotransferase system IIA component (Ntr-type)